MKYWLLAAALLLAGCADTSEPAPIEEEPTIHSDPQNVTLQAPVWQVGDYFGHHLYFGAQDTDGYHIDVILDREEGNNWHFVTDDPEVAKFEEVLDVPITGTLSKTDLDTGAFGGAWELYDFPMFDGKTWTGTVQYDFFGSHDVTFTATYSEDVTLFQEGRPGFDIVGVNANGTIVVETDYDPSFGWYNELLVYSDAGPEEDFIFRTMHMGWGHNWTGTAYEYEAELSINDAGQMIAPAGPSGLQNVAQPLTRTITDESTHLMILQYCFAVGGANDARLRAPSGAEYDCQAVDVPSSPDPASWGGTGFGDFYEIPHETGDWVYNRASAGFVAGGGLELWILTENEIVL